MKTLPDISKWQIDRSEDMSYMFSYCSSLLVFPDISNWKISKNTNIKNIFIGCSSLPILPKLWKWNIVQEKNVNQIFSSSMDKSDYFSNFLEDQKIKSIGDHVISSISALKENNNDKSVESEVIFDEINNNINNPFELEELNEYNCYDNFYE